MEQNFRRVPPPPRPFIPRPPINKTEEKQIDKQVLEEVKEGDFTPESEDKILNQSQINSVGVNEPIQDSQPAQVEKKTMNPKLKQGLLIAGSALCFIVSIVCAVLLIV